MQVGRIPSAEGLQRSHQNPRRSSPEKSPPRSKPRERLSGGEEGAPQGGECHHRRCDKAWAIAVQANADGQKHESECRVKQTGHQAEVGRTQSEFVQQIRSYDGVGRSEEVSDEVRDRKQTKDVDAFGHAASPTILGTNGPSVSVSAWPKST